MKTAKKMLQDSDVRISADSGMGQRIIELMKEYAQEVALKTLKHASEIALMKFHCGTFKADTPTQYHQMGADNIQIDKESITKTKIETP